MRRFIIYFFWAALCTISFCSQRAWGTTERWHTVDSQLPQGFHWYNETVESAHHEPLHSPSSTPDQGDPSKQMAALRTMVRQALDRAILYPSVDNAAHYLALNNLLTKNASDFSLTLQEALLLHPEMNYALTHPTQSAARKLMLKEKEKDRERLIKKLATTEGFFFFYRGNNYLDQLMVKTVEDFSRHYHIVLIGISVDGKVLPGFPVNRFNRGQAKQFGVKAYPALLMVNPTAHWIQPIAYGVLSESELLKRLQWIASHFNIHQ